jgi:hypothetical protein
MEEIVAISLQTKLIRQMQADDGQEICFATSASYACLKNECCWRHDCFDEALDSRLQQGSA